MNGIALRDDAGIAKARAELQANPGKPVVVSYRQDGTVQTRRVILGSAEGVDGQAIGRLGVQFRVEAGERVSAGPIGGLTSAVKCMGAGFVAGGVALVAAPVVGFKEKGWN